MKKKKDTTVKVPCPNCNAPTDWDRIQTFGICADCDEELAEDEYEAEQAERDKLHEFERGRI